jgi:toxin FitB
VNVVDSSGWLEYLVDGPGADHFAPVIEDTGELLVPEICLLEVARVVFRERGEHALEGVKFFPKQTEK